MDKYVHFSIDDINSPFKWLQANRPESIFEMRFFGNLLK